MNIFGVVLAVGVAASLVACGGGGGGGGSSGPIASTNTFNVQSGYKALTAAGWSKTFTTSGCTGSISITESAPTTSTTFEGSAALAGTSVISTSFTNCTPATSSTTETRYYDTNYVRLGYSVQGGGYGVYASAPVIPVTAKVGDTGIVGSINRYTNSTKATSAGRQDVSFVVEADTATTAILNVISKVYDASSTLQVTEQDRYKVAADGSLTPYSMDIQYANGVHIVGN